MRVLVTAAAVAALLAVLVAAPAGARSSAKPGPWCGGTLWQQMTLSDKGNKSVAWSPATTSLADIGKLAAPAKITTVRSTKFQKQNWSLDKVIIERYRQASNGEIVFQLFDVGTNVYMNAYLENSSCLPKTTRARGDLLKARAAFLNDCPAPTKDWQMLGATAKLTGVGFFNPVRTTLGALTNGAELRPLTSLQITQGCGHF
jgi:hypothetical protein